MNEVEISGEGQATHLGRFTWTSKTISPDLCTYFPNFDLYDDSVTLTAANGVNSSAPHRHRLAGGLHRPDQDPVVSKHHHITGGTGRFQVRARRWAYSPDLRTHVPAAIDSLGA
jgi:hypothetical protein